MSDERDRGESVREVLHQSMVDKSPTVVFEKIWEESQRLQRQTVGGNEMMKKPIKKINKKLLLIVAVITAILSISTLSANHMKRVDDISYTFKNDKEVLGPWTVVDLVKEESDFIAGEKQWEGELDFLTYMDFKANGDLSMAVQEEGENLEFLTSMKWTKGHIISKENQTNSAYTIKKIDGKNYLFYEWKSGDYTYKRLEVPYLYVLEQGKHLETVEAKGKVDNTNLPFVDDETMQGTWKAVDFVEEMEHFAPEGRAWSNDLYVKELTIKEDGNFVEKRIGDTVAADGKYVYWIKGALVYKNFGIVSKCVIQELEGETYMFVEWKFGQYQEIGIMPGYYVFKKQ
ncbi:MAG: hypothetical protein ACRDDX_03350 [Cellulosilyticaceae bacterium]